MSCNMCAPETLLIFLVARFASAKAFTRILFLSARFLNLAHLNVPFLAPWKKNLTTSTCNPAIPAIIKTSIKLKLNILLSVLFTVLKFLFSLVRKYFCIREIVLN